ncbi:hypothetical protein ACQEVF_56965 [Nonomuraea polychroma]|uniref:hypothetical protein n=1 Tax=Nonomuraea polychroma TaxID=46176 RepID=UPI003D8DD273
MITPDDPRHQIRGRRTVPVEDASAAMEAAERAWLDRPDTPESAAQRSQETMAALRVAAEASRTPMERLAEEVRALVWRYARAESGHDPDTSADYHDAEQHNQVRLAFVTVARIIAEDLREHEAEAAQWARMYGASLTEVGEAAGLTAEQAFERYRIPAAWAGNMFLPQPMPTEFGVG